MRRGLLIVAVLLCAGQASAQTYRTSPNGPVELTSTASAPATLDVKGMGTATISVVGTGTFELTFQVVTEDGQTQALNCTPPNSTTPVTQATASGRWGSCNVAGYPTIRVVPTGSWSTGNAKVVLSAAGTGGGGGGGGGSFSGTVSAATTTDPDDASIAAAQTNDNVNALNMAFDATVWRRMTFGVAGTPSAQVWSMQGVAGGTALPVSGTFWQATQPISIASMPALTAGTAVIGHVIVDTTSTTAVTQATGTNLHMVCDSGCSSSAGFADNAAFTYGTTAVNPIAGVLDDVATNAPTENSAAVVRITTAKALHTNLAQYLGAAISVTNPIAIRISDGSGFLSQDTQLTYNTANTWSTTTGGAQFFRASTSAPTAVTTDRPVAPWGTTAGALYITPSYGDVAAATGTGASGATVPRVVAASDSPEVTALQLIDDDQTGWTGGYVTSAASTNSTSVKGSAGRISSINLVNTTATLYYLRLYAASSAPTCSSATGFLVSLPIPASTTGSGFTMSFPNGGLAVATGIGYCLTGGSASTDNTNAATGVFGIITYK